MYAHAFKEVGQNILIEIIIKGNIFTDMSHYVNVGLEKLTGKIQL